MIIASIINNDKIIIIIIAINIIFIFDILLNNKIILIGDFIGLFDYKIWMFFDIYLGIYYIFNKFIINIF